MGMVRALSNRRPQRSPVGLAWAGTHETTVAYFGEHASSGVAWHLFLDRLRRSERPLVIQLDERTALDETQRRELAEAVGPTSRVAVIAASARARALSTGLRWLGVEAEFFRINHVLDVARYLGIDRRKLAAALNGLDAAA